MILSLDIRNKENELENELREKEINRNVGSYNTSG